MKHISLFSGIGGFDLASEWMGWENVAHCEMNPICQKVLKFYWPNSETFTDIKNSDFTKYADTIDILTGGFPCQPYSAAGKRLGKEDERHLWPEMLRAIREIRPRWIVGENVRGLTNWNGGLVFDEVQSDLEIEGYEVTPFLLPACAVNAPHRRDRIWFIAYAHSNGHQLRRLRKDRPAQGAGKGDEKKRKRIRDNNWRASEQETSPDSPDSNAQLKRQDRRRKYRNQSIRRKAMRSIPRNISQQKHAPDPKCAGLERREFDRASNPEGQEGGQQSSGPTPQLHQITDWRKFPTQSPVRGRNDGFPAGLDGITVSKHRNESKKAYGNAIVPQVAYQIFKAIEQYEKLYA